MLAHRLLCPDDMAFRRAGLTLNTPGDLAISLGTSDTVSWFFFFHFLVVIITIMPALFFLYDIIAQL